MCCMGYVVRSKASLDVVRLALEHLEDTGEDRGWWDTRWSAAAGEELVDERCWKVEAAGDGVEEDPAAPDEDDAA